MKAEISIVGFGALSQEVYELTRELNWKVSNFYVEERYFEESKGAKSFDEIFLLPENSSVFVAIGLNFERFRIVQKLKKRRPDFQFPTLVHPSSQIALSSSIGQGCLILRNSSICSNARVKNFALINNAALVEHDAEVNEYSSLGPRSSLLGAAKLGKFSFLGAHSCVLQERMIGERSALGAMSLLTNNLPPEQLWIGIPAKLHRSFNYQEAIYDL